MMVVVEEVMVVEEVEEGLMAVAEEPVCASDSSRRVPEPERASSRQCHVEGRTTNIVEPGGHLCPAALVLAVVLAVNQLVLLGRLAEIGAELGDR